MVGRELVVQLSDESDLDRIVDAISLIHGVDRVDDMGWQNVAVSWLMDAIRPYRKGLSPAKDKQLRAKLLEGVGLIRRAALKKHGGIKEGDKMNLLPTQCAARYREVELRASRLLETFINGNKNDALEALKDMEPTAALAVLAAMMRNADEDNRESLFSYFMEVA
jgi:hypothetical protein